MVSVVIPAYNEEKTIRGVIRAAEANPHVDEIVVVSDGSTDRTAEFARRTSAKVIELKKNLGKGEALEIGVANTKGDILVFLDADLIGLRPEALDRVIGPVERGARDMVVVARDQWFDVINFWHRAAIGGERALRRELWDGVPASLRKDFQIELALNHHALSKGMRMDAVRIRGLRHLYKVQKYGFLRGVAGEAKLAASCASVLWSLYVARPLRARKKERLRNRRGIADLSLGWARRP